MAIAKTVIDIAMAEVGYLEKRSNASLYDKTANAGTANYTKYGYEMHQVHPAVMDYPAAWCDAFVDWCFMKAYGVSTAKSLLGGGFDDYTVNSANMYKNKGAWHTYKEEPKAGDQIFFVSSGKAQTIGNICHTGLVYAVDANYVYTIEGNTSGASGVVANGGGVAKKSYLRTYSRIAGYGRPKYDAESKVVAEVQQKPQANKLDPAQSFDKALAGTYKVTASSLNLRCGAGTSKTIICAIPNGKEVKCYGYYTNYYGTKWLYVQYGNVTGFCSSQYLKR